MIENKFLIKNIHFLMCFFLLVLVEVYNDYGYCSVITIYFIIYVKQIWREIFDTTSSREKGIVWEKFVPAFHKILANCHIFWKQRLVKSWFMCANDYLITGKHLDIYFVIININSFVPTGKVFHVTKLYCQEMLSF